MPETLAQAFAQFTQTATQTQHTLAQKTWTTYRRGTGKPLLLFPINHWGAYPLFGLALHLSAQAHVILPDFPPFSTLEDLVSGVIACLPSEAESLSVVGIGTGGAVAQAFLWAQSHHIERVFLGNTSPPQSELALAFQQLSALYRFMPAPLLRAYHYRAFIQQAPPDSQAFWQGLSLRSRWQKQALMAQLRVMSAFHQATLPQPLLPNWRGKIALIDIPTAPQEDALGLLWAIYRQAERVTLHLPPANSDPTLAPIFFPKETATAILSQF